MTTHYAERIAVEIDGEGDAVLMLHGLGGTSNTLTALASAFARYEARAPRPAGVRALRSRRRRAVDRALRAGALRALAAAGVERAHVVAHSMGTIVAAHLAALHPRSCAASRCSARCSRRRTRRAPTCARAAQKARSEGRACRRSPTRWCRRRRRRRPRRSGRGGRVRARVADAPAARRLCALVRGAGRCAARGCRAHRVPDAARHRRRGRGRAAAVGAADGREDRRRRRRGRRSKYCAAAGTGRRSRCPTNARASARSYARRIA